MTQFQLEKIETSFNIDIRSFQQQFDWSCGPAALRTVLYYQFGIDLTDRELSLVCGSNESGTDELNFETGLKILGFKYKQNNKGTLSKLKNYLIQSKLPIVHLVMQDGVGHYMIFCGYDVDNVYLSDPIQGKIVKYGTAYFMGIWKEEEKETQTRWSIVITGKANSKIAATINKLKHIKKKIGVI